MGGSFSKLCVTPPFSINFRCQIENQVSDYRLLGASSCFVSPFDPQNHFSLYLRCKCYFCFVSPFDVKSNFALHLLCQGYFCTAVSMSIYFCTASLLCRSYFCTASPLSKLFLHSISCVEASPVTEVTEEK